MYAHAQAGPRVKPCQIHFVEAEPLSSPSPSPSPSLSPSPSSSPSPSPSAGHLRSLPHLRSQLPLCGAALFLPRPPVAGEKEELYNFIQGKADLLVEEDEESILQRLWKNLAWHNKTLKHRLNPGTRKTGIKPLPSTRSAYSTYPHKLSG